MISNTHAHEVTSRGVMYGIVECRLHIHCGASTGIDIVSLNFKTHRFKLTEALVHAFVVHLLSANKYTLVYTPA